MEFILAALALLVVAGVCRLWRLGRGGGEGTAVPRLVIIVGDQEPWIEGFVRRLFCRLNCRGAPPPAVQVVDHHSRDGTADVLSRLRRYYPFELVRAGTGGDSGAAGPGAAGEGASAARRFDVRGLKGRELLDAPLFCRLSRTCAGKSRPVSK